MPRHSRISPDGFVQHICNRGDHRETLFHKPADFLAFIRVIAEATRRVPMRILAYCVMRNHFHLLLWPDKGTELPAYMQVLMNRHIRRHLLHYPPDSAGHLYQGRYRNSLVQTNASVLRVRAYIERNPLKAGLVSAVEHYPWSSASHQASEGGRPMLDDGPVPIPPDWLKRLNRHDLNLDRDEIEIQRAARRGAPYGDTDWIEETTRIYGLSHTRRARGRPPVYERIEQ